MRKSFIQKKITKNVLPPVDWKHQDQLEQIQIEASSQDTHAVNVTAEKIEYESWKYCYAAQLIQKTA